MNDNYCIVSLFKTDRTQIKPNIMIWNYCVENNKYTFYLDDPYAPYADDPTIHIFDKEMKIPYDPRDSKTEQTKKAWEYMSAHYDRNR